MEVEPTNSLTEQYPLEGPSTAHIHLTSEHDLQPQHPILITQAPPVTYSKLLTECWKSAELTTWKLAL